MIPQIVVHQAPLSMGFSRQEYWSGLPFPSPEDLPNTGIEPGSPALQADSLLFELQGSPKIKKKKVIKLRKKRPTCQCNVCIMTTMSESVSCSVVSDSL